MRQTEMHVISSCLTTRDHLFKTLQYSEEIFQEYDMRIFRNILAELFKTQQMVDLPCFISQLEIQKPKGIKINDIISEIIKLGTCHDIDFILKQLENKKTRIKLTIDAENLIDSLKNNELNYDELIDTIIRDKEKNRLDDICVFIDYINETPLDEIFSSLKYIPTNIKKIDEKIFGFYGGQFVIIAARPGVGKTSLAIEIMLQVNEPILFFSLEMTRREIYAKMLSARATVESWKILFNKLLDNEREEILKAHEYLKDKLKILMFDNEINLPQMVYYINNFVNYKRPEIIIIDYLQLLSGAHGENQNVRVGTISRTLKLLAMKHKIPIIALSQLSRAGEKEGRSPVLSDLRDSGSLEQDANMVIFLHEDKDKNGFKIIVAKNRMGRTGEITNIKFNKKYSRFEETEISNPEYFQK